MIPGNGAWPVSEEEEGICGDRDICCELMTDDRGWPLIKFDPDDKELRLAGAFLQDDVGLLQATCDEVMQGVQRIIQDWEEEWIWNGDRFPCAGSEGMGRTMTDKIWSGRF